MFFLFPKNIWQQQCEQKIRFLSFSDVIRIAASLPINRRLETDLGYLDCPIVTAEMFLSKIFKGLFSTHSKPETERGSGTLLL